MLIAILFPCLRRKQLIAVLFSVLVLTQDVLGQSTAEKSRRKRYKSSFEGLFKGAREIIKSMTLMADVKDKELQTTAQKALQFAKANPDKIALAAAIAASSWLLYDSITIGFEIEGFFDEVHELKGQFNKYKMNTIPRLQEVFKKLQSKESLKHDQLKEYLRNIAKELDQYYEDLQNIIDTVLYDVNTAKPDAVINAALSGALAVGAATALIAGGPVVLSLRMYTAGCMVVGGISSAGTALSLKNAHDLMRVEEKLKTLKSEVMELRNLVNKRMLDILLFV
ncbi:uncharacterized protein LOC116609454 [Nematostella vectensis]|uniref:uncharacterized protein LOC116609454 n=1 Tax=Nematostella vectensis TaxID=45351 RepID=UPI0013902C38|nr:uncharacterized protein LOC116609454 [Nematostella vectensis]